MTQHAQYVLMSGASSGIGKAASEALADVGITVFAGALNENEAAQMRAAGRKGIVPVVLDVTNTDSIDAAIEQVRAGMGSDGYLYGLVNVAGVDHNAPLQFLEPREITQMVNVNLTGGMLLTRAALPLMRHGASRVVFVSSAMGLLPTPIVQVYCGTKHGIEGFADALRIELNAIGIKVALVEPGVIRTPMTSVAMSMFDRMIARLDVRHRGVYEKAMRKIAESSANPPKSSATTDDTSRAIRDALTAPRPARRYQVGVDCKGARIVGMLPHAIQDWIQRKVLAL